MASYNNIKIMYTLKTSMYIRSYMVINVNYNERFELKQIVYYIIILIRSSKSHVKAPFGLNISMYNII